MLAVLIGRSIRKGQDPLPRVSREAAGLSRTTTRSGGPSDARPCLDKPPHKPAKALEDPGEQSADSGEQAADRAPQTAYHTHLNLSFPEGEYPGQARGIRRKFPGAADVDRVCPRPRSAS